MSSKLENAQRRILVVDDDPDSQKVLMKALGWESYQVKSADNGTEAIEQIKTWNPHLVLLDVNMPGLNGLETLQHLRENQEYVSTLFVSANTETTDIVRGLDAGADDYVCKPINPEELLGRIRCHFRIKDIRDELRRANGRLKELVDRDDLTGLFNMRSLYQKLDYELERAHRYGRQVGVIMMDLDHFKSVNDDNDHLFGSFVISDVGRIIRENIRKVDFAARYGGDEFLIVLTEINPSGAFTFAERLRQSIKSQVFTQGPYKKNLTGSLGLAVTGAGGSGLDARNIVREADKALYKAKEGGRDQTVMVDLGADSTLVAPDGYIFRKKAAK